jgi:hypothetical protein
VLLLDEADVYLEQRVRQDIVRNGLVAVFLRSLEYCKGIFFLTSNRLDEFDPAICSRIHLFMKYNDLEEWARRDVWNSLLNRAGTIGGPACISTRELDRLVAIASNGRQVRSNNVASFLVVEISITDQKLCRTRPRPRKGRPRSSWLLSHQNSCQGQWVDRSRFGRRRR